MARMNTTSGDNPFFQPWTGPFGVPEFSRVKTEHFMPAYERAFAEHMAEIDAIAKDPAPPTFENTILAYEEAGRMLERVDNVFNNLVGTDSTDELLKIEADISPVSAAHWNKVRMNEGLFRRIDALFQKRDSLGLTAEQKRVLERHHTSFRRNGAALDADKKKRLAEVTERLATLGTSFSQNVLADEQSYALELSEDDVAGLPDFVKDAARAAAEERKLTAKYAVTLQRSSVEPFLQFSSRRDLREKIFRAFLARGDKNDATDNKAIIAETIKLAPSCSATGLLRSIALTTPWRRRRTMCAVCLKRSGSPRASARLPTATNFRS
jgi:peptidyl-dipeptidase Dcp